MNPGRHTRANRRPGAGLAAPVLLILASCSDQIPSDPTAALPAPTAARSAAAGGSAYVPGRVLAGFTAGSDPAGIASAHGARLDRELLLRGIWMLSVPAGRERAVAAALGRHAGVSFAEPDWLRILGDPTCDHCQTPNDQFFEWRWDLHNDGDVVVYPYTFQTGKVDADVDWLEAFDQLGSSPGGTARIGIVDTGVRATHEDLCGKVAAGHDFYNGDTDASDDHGHGTHVTGIAAACANNGDGAMGIAYGAGIDVVAAKVCSFEGVCPSSAITEGIVWAVDQGAHVVNLSLGGPDSSTVERSALRYALEHGALPVCAAGNDGTASVLYPARFDECIAVSSTDWGDDLASYSSYGAAVDVAAPGGDFEESFFGTSYIVSTYNASDSDYIQAAGTSMAAPQVSGLAALLHALGVSGPDAIRQRIESTADDLGESGRDDRFGHGRINVYRAINGDANPAPENSPPTAGFTESCTDLACAFDGTGSSDADGTIQSWAWDFGDGSTGSGPTVDHTYAADGTYTVRLTVTDDDGATDSEIRDVTVSSGSGGGGISLTATPYKVKGRHTVDLAWTGAASTEVDVYRDGALVATTANDGAYTDAAGGRGKGSYVYRVCEAGTATCSDEVTASFD